MDKYKCGYYCYDEISCNYSEIHIVFIVFIPYLHVSFFTISCWS